MPYDPHKHHRRSIRLPGFDYSQAGAYFVTICVQHGECLLGSITDGEMSFSPAGQMVDDFWSSLPVKFPTAALDSAVTMPNHVHAIIVLGGADPAEQQDLLTQAESRPSLSRIVQWYKSISTARYRHAVEELSWPPFHGRLWHRNYYEHIIRNEESLNILRAYILNNPAKWKDDALHPNAPPNPFNRDRED